MTEKQHYFSGKKWETIVGNARWEEYGRAHGEFFRDVRPCATMVEVRRLIDDRMLIEIEADAILL